MTKTPVIPIDEAKREAYSMGYERFTDVEVENGENFELSHFKEYANWANNIHPSIRALAGYEDSKGGTYTVNREVVTVEAHTLEDMPMMGEKTEAHFVESELLEAFDTGAYDAVDDREKFESLY